MKKNFDEELKDNENAETIIIRDGKPVYAIKLTKYGDKQYMYMYNGRIYFTDSYLSCTQFDFNNETHKIAKTIFIDELRTDIRRKILELKELEEILRSLGMDKLVESFMSKNDMPTLVFNSSDDYKETIYRDYDSRDDCIC